MTLDDIKDIIRVLSTLELKDELRLYTSLQSRGTADEIIISLLEQELDARGIELA